MKRLLFLLLLGSPAFAACSITVFVSGTQIQSAPMNANFASLNACKPQRFSGTSLPANITGSLLGDIYQQKSGSINDTYMCFAAGPCTAVAANNWVKINGTGGGGTGTVTVVSSGSLTSTACVTGGGTTTIQTGTGCTISSTGDMVAHSYASSDTTHSGGTLYNGLTSGSVMLAAADIAGTAIVYVLPSTNGTSGQVLTDNGVIACPTLASGSPSVCHQLTWATGGGGGSGTVTSVGLTGTANQITVTGSSPITTSGSFALSIPTNPTLPGTTTGTFSGNLTGNVTGTASTASAVAVGGITGLGTGVATALGANVSGSGAICLATGSACAGGGGGSFVLVEQHTISGTPSTVDFTTCISSTYDEYQVELVSVVPTTDAVNVLMRVGTVSGFDSGSNYSWAIFRASDAGSTQTGGAGQTSFGIDGSATQSNSATIGGLVGTVRLYSPGNASFHPRVKWETGANDGSGSPDVVVMGTGSYLSTTAVTKFQFLPSGGGTFASGIIRCYGIAK